MVYAACAFLDTREEMGDQHDLAFKRLIWLIRTLLFFLILEPLFTSTLCLLFKAVCINFSR